MFFNSLLPSNEFFYYRGRKRRHRRKLIGGGGGFCDWICMRMLMLDEEGMEGGRKMEYDSVVGIGSELENDSKYLVLVWSFESMASVRGSCWEAG